MVAKTLASSGAWDAAGIWSPTGKPTINDDVTIPAGRKFSPPASGEMQFGTMIIDGEGEVDSDIAIKNGGYILIGTTGQIYRSASSPVQRRIYCPTANGRYQIRMVRSYPDNRRIDLGGYVLAGVSPSISAEGSGGSYSEMATLLFNDDSQSDYYLGEQGLPSLGGQLEEQLNEGVGKNSCKWRRGQVRSMRYAVKWPKHAPGGSAPWNLDYYEVLDRMTRAPYNVLIATPWNLFRGHIESVITTRVEGGRSHGATMTVVEGGD